MSLPPASPETTSIRRQLRATVDGRVVTVDDAGYDRARTLFWAGPSPGCRPTPPPSPTASGG